MKRDCQRHGDWFQTFTGRKFWPLDPLPEDIFIEDIAHALSLITRFGGHIPEPYSVAQHSLIVASYSGPDTVLALCGLMHDAPEAYLGDMVAPLKRGMPEFRAAESRVWSAIAKRYDLPDPIPAHVMEIDRRLLIDEARSFWPDRIDTWEEKLGCDALGRGLIIPVNPWSFIEDSFLGRFRNLTRLREREEANP